MLYRLFSLTTLLPKIFYSFLILNIVNRLVIFTYLKYSEQTKLNIIQLFSIISIGTLNDIITFSYFITLYLLMKLIFLNKSIGQKNIVKISYLIYFILVSILLFNFASEILFWEEFGSRYNFIAVDYLIYTKEVIGNIVESYPVSLILMMIFLIALCWILLDFKYIGFRIDKISKKNNILFIIICIIINVIIFNFWNNSLDFSDRYNNEISKNGIYNLFSAFRNNQLNYGEFYEKLPNEQAFLNLRKIFKNNGKFINSNIYDISRYIEHKKHRKNYNIVIISVESLSAEFIKYYGNQDNITPNIDSIIKDSLVFDNYFATGTRTIRGLEAMVLSIPPTPGSSIIRRPNNENLYSIATIFNQYDYQVSFLYGGFGYFDNMNYFFENNGFRVIDRSSIKKEDIIFANIWGVADEVLFNKAIEEANNSHKEGKKFFSLLMTTSNHRPYTYPEGRIDIPSGIGKRNGAIKYTDYAIGKFLNDSKKTKWFKDTIFIITADHCASSAGKTKLPINKYHIPLIIYAPDIIKPGVISNLSSQIDLAPTVFGLLNMNYVSRFFGSDIINNPLDRAFLSTYQIISLMKHKNLMLMSPRRKAELFRINDDYTLNNIDIEEDILNEFISYYQAADYLFSNKLMKTK